MDNGQREGQTDEQIDGQSERWTNRNTDIGTSGRRDFPPLSPQRGIESLKSTSIGFYLSNRAMDVQMNRRTDKRTDRQKDRQTDQRKAWRDG